MGDYSICTVGSRGIDAQTCNVQIRATYLLIMFICFPSHRGVNRYGVSGCLCLQTLPNCQQSSLDVSIEPNSIARGTNLSRPGRCSVIVFMCLIREGLFSILQRKNIMLSLPTPPKHRLRTN